MGRPRLTKEMRHKGSTRAESEHTPFNYETCSSSHVLGLPSIQILWQDHHCQKPPCQPPSLVPPLQPRFLNPRQFPSGLSTEDYELASVNPLTPQLHHLQ